MLEVIESTERFARPFIQKGWTLERRPQRPAQVWPVALGAVVIEELVALLGLGLLKPTSRSVRRLLRFRERRRLGSSLYGTREAPSCALDQPARLWIAAGPVAQSALRRVKWQGGRISPSCWSWCCNKEWALRFGGASKQFSGKK